uniref:Secreted protein n=1 Tax=Anopheles darlingi TaxID=43151 RepID=A0A2M4DR07_ANODA
MQLKIIPIMLLMWSTLLSGHRRCVMIAATRRRPASVVNVLGATTTTTITSGSIIVIIGRNAIGIATGILAVIIAIAIASVMKIVTIGRIIGAIAVPAEVRSKIVTESHVPRGARTVAIVIVHGSDHCAASARHRIDYRRR